MEIISIKETLDYHNNSLGPYSISMYSHHYLWKLLRDRSDIPYNYLIFILVFNSHFICRVSMNAQMVRTIMDHIIKFIYTPS